MKKALLILFCLMLCAPALAEGDGRALMVSATVECLETYEVKAPFSGDVEAFSLRAGDTVKQGDALFTLTEKTLYAPMDGVVAAVFAEKGDVASAVQQRYGELLLIDPNDRLRVSCDARTGYDSVETRDVRAGASVFLKTAEGNKRTGEGRIISVSGSAFTVEITMGDLLFEDNVYVYLASEMKNSQKLARGTVSAAAPLPVTGAGTITQVLVRRGDKVKRGDALLTYIPDELGQGAPSRTVTAEKNGVVKSVQATGGMTVQKGQTLATVCNASAFALRALLDEGDVNRVTAGDSALVTFEELSLDPIPATVKCVSALGNAGETATYEVLFACELPTLALLGMHATVTIE